MAKTKKNKKKQDVYQFQEVVFIPRDQFEEFKRQMESRNTEEVQGRASFPVPHPLPLGGRL